MKGLHFVFDVSFIGAERVVLSLLLMRFLLGLTRTLVALGLGLWIGGLVFFGAITAAIMFRMTREAGVADMAPRMVGPMLSRFAIVCTVCSFILVGGWLLDGILTLTTRALWWRLQGGLTVIAVSLGAYLNFGLLPTVERDQPAVLPLYVRSQSVPSSSPPSTPAPLSPEEAELKARFDAGHAQFKRLSFIDIWLLVGALACLMARSLPAEVGRQQSN
ncbi:hypothetical protein IAD21_02622 [Abditibacteriota bacterium]|nr:hypothetical protein IAD21_02622 [Abditibacteriota bacterium]